MKEQLEEKFEELAIDIITDAEAVECSLGEFLEGLKIIAVAINTRINGVKEELASGLVDDDDDLDDDAFDDDFDDEDDE